MSKGFYIALCSVVAIVGFSIYSGKLRADMEERNASFEEIPWDAVSSLEEVEVIDVDGETIPKKTETPVTSFEKVPEVVETAAAAEPKSERAKFVMELPHSGEVIAECSIDELV